MLSVAMDVTGESGVGPLVGMYALCVGINGGV